MIEALDDLEEDTDDEMVGDGGESFSSNVEETETLDLLINVGVRVTKNTVHITSLH